MCTFSRRVISAKTTPEMQFSNKLGATFFLLLGIVFFQPVWAVENRVDTVDGYKLSLPGRKDSGFNFYLVTQLKKKKKEDLKPTESAVMIDGSPEYEGFGLSGTDHILVRSSLKSLEEHDRLAGATLPEHSSAWAQHSLEISIGQKATENFLQRLSKNKKAFIDALSGIPESKANLLYSLLFEDSVRLSTEIYNNEHSTASSSDPTLESLKLNSSNPDPEPTRITLHTTPIGPKILGWDFVEDIYIEKITFHFLKKEIQFLPPESTSAVVGQDRHQGVFRVHLQASSAEIEGKYHNIGNWREISR
ncbi:MAG: hypothetical protein JWQ35_851, partial [Bacteriovoracaceae bacterium]|nr:hypothetical protein [Bacteriovoracaceae bacterium]